MKELLEIMHTLDFVSMTVLMVASLTAWTCERKTEAIYFLTWAVFTKLTLLV